MQFSSNYMYLGTTFDEKKYLELETEATKIYMLDEMAYQEDAGVPRSLFARLVNKIPSGCKKIMKKTKLALLRLKSQWDAETSSTEDEGGIVQPSPIFNESRAQQDVSIEPHPSSSPMEGELNSILPEEAEYRGTNAVNSTSPLSSRSHAEIPAAGKEFEVGWPNTMTREYQPLQGVTLELLSTSFPPKKDLNSSPTLSNRNMNGTDNMNGSQDDPRSPLFSRANSEADKSKGLPTEDYVCYEDDGPRRFNCLGPCEEPKPYIEPGTVHRLATLLKPLWAGKDISDDPPSDLSTGSMKRVRANSSAPRVEFLIQNRSSNITGFSAEGMELVHCNLSGTDLLQRLADVFPQNAISASVFETNTMLSSSALEEQWAASNGAAAKMHD